MEYLGTATWSASEKPLSALGGCLTVDYLLGAGVAVYNNPTGVRLSYLTSQLYKPSAQSAALTAQIDGAVAEDLGNIGRTRRQVQELTLRASQRRQEFQNEVRQQLGEAQANAEELGNRLRSAEFELAHAQVRAPVAGTVVGLSVFTEGGVIARGQPLMEIVPDDAPLLVDARAPVELIDRLRPGLPVELLFVAFNQSTTPRVAGYGSLVSADRLLDDKTQQPYYQVRIKVSDEGARQLSGLDIRPGMPVEAFVRSGERSLLNYLFKPLADRVHLALSEE